MFKNGLLDSSLKTFTKLVWLQYLHFIFGRLVKRYIWIQSLLDFFKIFFSNKAFFYLKHSYICMRTQTFKYMNTILTKYIIILKLILPNLYINFVESLNFSNICFFFNDFLFLLVITLKTTLIFAGFLSISHFNCCRSILFIISFVINFF